MYSSSRFKLTTIFFLLLIFVISLVLLGSTKLATHAASTPLQLSAKSENSSTARVSNCGAWNVISSPNIGTGQNQLIGVTAISATNAWAVGDYTNGSGYEQTLIEQWNGTSWNVVSSPNVGIGNNSLSAVAAISANNIWAVGEYPYNNNFQSLIEQWNGTSWNVVSSPIIGTYGSVLDGIARVPGTNKVWAIGYEVNSGIVQTLIEQWNGTSWNVVSSPNVGLYTNYLTGITAISANNIWAVGWDENSMNGPAQTLTEHWDGTSWSVVSSPNPGAGISTLNSITRIGSTGQLVAVGVSAYSLYTPTQTLIEQWNGTSWNVVSSPNVGIGYNHLSGVVAISANNIWAVGEYSYTDNNSFRTLIEHWDGASWNVFSSPNPGINGDYLDSVVRVPYTNRVWTVGYYDNTSNGPYQTLVESYC